MLSTAELEHYRTKGYVVPDYVLPEGVLNDMRQAYARLIERNPDISPDFMLGPHLDNPGTQGVKGAEEWLEFATHPDLITMAASRKSGQGSAPLPNQIPPSRAG